MNARTNWKKKAEELEREVRRVRAYAFDYGNATGECESGYLQHPNYICHKCNADDYRKGCPLAIKKASKP
jgi:hypothetical protein